MSLSVGSLVAYLDLDDSNFDRKTKNANRQIDNLSLHLKALAQVNPELKIKTEAALAKLQAAKDRLAEIKAEAKDPAEMRVDVAAAMFKLAAVRAEIRALHAEASKPVALDTSPARSALDSLAKSLDNASKKTAALSGPKGLAGLALTLGPTLVPAGMAAIGVLGGIASAATEAVAGLGVMAVAFKGVSGAATAFSSYQTAMSKATTPKQRAAAQSTLNASAYGKSSAVTQQFARFDVNQLHPFGASMVSAAQAGVLPGLQSGLGSLVKVAPQINGAITMIGASVGNLAAQAGRALNSPFWKQFIVWFGKDSAKNVGTMGHAMGQLITAFAHMDQRSGGAGKFVGEIDRLATKLNGWSASPAFLSFLDTVRKDEAVVGRFFHALWVDLGPFLKGVGEAGRGELGVLSGALGLISHLPTGFLEAAGKWLPIIMLSMKFASGPLAAASTGVKNLSDNIGIMASSGVSKMEMLKTGFGNAMKSMAGPVGIGLLLDSTTHATGAMNTLEMAAGGAAFGFSVGGPLGAAIGGIGGVFAAAIKSSSLFNRELSDAQVIDNARSAYANLGDTLDILSGKFTDVTHARNLDNITKNGTLQAALNAGFNPRQANQLSLGEADAGTRARYNRMRSSATTDVATAQARVSSDLSHGHGQFDLKYIADQNAVAAAKKELDLLIALGGAGEKAAQGWADQYAALHQWTPAQLAAANAISDTRVRADLLSGKIKPLTGDIEKYAVALNLPKSEVKTIVEMLGVDKSRVDLAAIMAYLTAINGAKITANVSVSAIPFSKNAGRPAHALGTNFAPGGFSWVGEQGRELINIPRGSQIIPHGRSEQMVRQGQGSGAGRMSLDQETVNRLAQAIADGIRGGTQHQIDNSLVYAGGY